MRIARTYMRCSFAIMSLAPLPPFFPCEMVCEMYTNRRIYLSYCIHAGASIEPAAAMKIFIVGLLASMALMTRACNDIMYNVCSSAPLSLHLCLPCLLNASGFYAATVQQNCSLSCVLHLQLEKGSFADIKKSP